MYERLQDIRDRLEGTIIRYGSNPVLVSGSDGSNIFIQFLNGTKGEIVSIKDKKLNFKSIPLGYVNYRGTAYYLQRIPERRWKVGISRGGVYTATPNSPIDALLGKPLHNTVRNIYSSYEKTLEDINKKSIASIAFNRLIAVKKEDLGNMKLEYRGINVGWYENNNVILGKDYTHLKEHLSIKGVKIHDS